MVICLLNHSKPLYLYIVPWLCGAPLTVLLFRMEQCSPNIAISEVLHCPSSHLWCLQIALSPRSVSSGVQEEQYIHCAVIDLQLQLTILFLKVVMTTHLFFLRLIV